MVVTPRWNNLTLGREEAGRRVLQRSGAAAGASHPELVSVRSVVVLGAGVSGMAALLLSRAGHRVALIERDGFDVGAAEDAPRWLRKGVHHFLQPHALIPRARAGLVASLPDVYASLLEAGARDVDLRRKLPAAPTPQGVIAAVAGLLFDRNESAPRREGSTPRRELPDSSAGIT
jgi:hypothetical protein